MKEEEEEEKKVWTTMDGWMDYQDKQPFYLSRECLVSMYMYLLYDFKLVKEMMIVVSLFNLFRRIYRGT
jgi:hypothetical protein